MLSLLYFKLLFMLKYIFFLSIITLSNDFLFGQQQIKEKTEIAYRISNQDSTIRFQRTTSYDEKGRIITKQNYYYQSKEKGLLTKEEKAYFNTTKETLTEQIISYARGKEPKTQKLITKYLLYANKEKDSKRIWRKHYDTYGELTKEDTLTYNSSQQVVEHCKYDYKGNTSLICDYHIYNKKGLPSQWTTFTKWTTIDGKGEVANRQARRRNYRHRYNKNGQLVWTKGKYYKNHFSQKIKYDKNSQILKDKILRKRKIKVPVPKKKVEEKTQTKVEKKTKYRNKTLKEEQIQSYKNGRITNDSKLVNKKEVSQTKISYQDKLPKLITLKQKGVLAEETEYVYNDSTNIITKKTLKKYGPKGKYRYAIITFFNSIGKPTKEEQMMGKKTLSVLEIEYDKGGNPVMRSLSTNNNKNFEKTMYIYKYY
jgi:hypothetical protein